MNLGRDDIRIGMADHIPRRAIEKHSRLRYIHVTTANYSERKPNQAFIRLTKAFRANRTEWAGQICRRTEINPQEQTALPSRVG